MLASQAGEGAGRRARGGGAAAGGARDLRDQPLQSGPRGLPHAARGARPRCRRPRGRLRAGLRPRVRVRFWGTRGSIPVAMTSRGGAATSSSPRWWPRPAAASTRPSKARAFVEHELDFSRRPTPSAATRPAWSSRPGGAEYVVCDLGSGARRFGNARARHARRPPATGSTSSCPTCTGTTSWASRSSARPTCPATAIRIYGCHDALEQAFRLQHAAPSLPGGLLAARRARSSSCASSPSAPTTIAGLTVRAKRQHHGGDSYGYRFERGGKVVVYSTDSEHKLDDPRGGRRRSSSSSATPTW